ncbi:MAG: aldehyde dehydrogenase family protein [Deltaproteobacteria bacterium]|nr:MAG: aldehyde dehydrogenase family protein [Deltaproteobacteria bacterium]
MSQYQREHPSDPTICRNPATGEVLGYSPLTGLEELEEIISNARNAQRNWAEIPVKQRVGYMVRVRDHVVEKAEELAEVISRDNGKTRVDALATEVMPAAMAIDYYAKHARGFLKPRRLRSGNIVLFNKRSKIVRVPYGVIGVISPWNYSFSIPFSEVVTGLLTGNAVVLKTATETQFVGRKLEECFLAAELPQGIFSQVNIPGRLAGSAFLKNGIDKLFFTGSETVGKQLMSEAGETLTPLVLELGGNDAMLVCDDADLHRAAAGAVWAGLSNSGQSCGGVERIYVQERAYKPFLELLKEKVEVLRLGLDEDFNVDLGVMTTERQAVKVRDQLEDALSKGAVIYAQSAEPKGISSSKVLPALVLTEVTHDMEVMREESFGPLLAVMKVDRMDEAVALANDSHLGLTGSVWSRNRKRADKLARQIQAGAVMINDHLMSHGLAETPWGGFKKSGIGRTHGAIGFDEMTQPQVIVHDVLPGIRRNVWWHPYGRGVYQGLLGVIQFLYGKCLPKRLKGLWHLLKVLPRCFTTR